MSHEHEGCRHDLRFCYQCDVAYCGKCDVNWSRHQWAWYVPNTTVTFPETPVNPFPNTITTYPNSTSSIPVDTNHAAHGSAA